jgi:phosphoglycolate phosphatase
MTLEALIFDLDGTLVDTAPDLHAATNHVLGLIDRPAITMAELRAFVGHGAMNLIERGVGATGAAVDRATLKQLHKQFLDYYGENISDHSVVFEGVLDVLDKAQSRGLKLGVCTNKVEGLSHKLLTELKMMQRFGSLIGGNTLTVMKPDPAPLIEAATRLGVNPKNIMLIGDSETDILTARNAGVPVMAVSFGYTAQHVSAYNPTHIIDHYNEAWAIIETYLS